MNLRFFILIQLFLLSYFSLPNQIINIKLGTDNLYSINEKTADIIIYKINTNYKTFSVKIYSITNIKTLQISDTKETNEISLCNSTSNFCESII